MRFLKLNVLVIAVLATLNVFAQEEEKKDPPLEISGFADVYYQYNFNENAPGLTSFTAANNSIELGMANVVLSKQVGKVGFVADLGFGQRANDANGTGNFTQDVIKQLYITYAPSDKVTLTAGNFGTHVGYEVIDANANFNYSTSYLFSYGPFYHTGIKADFAISDKVGFMVGVFNDTDSKTDVGGRPGKHIGAQFSYSDDKTGLYINYLGGDAGVDDVLAHQVDITATHQATDDLLIGVNASNKSWNSDNDAISNSSWFGAALYLNYEVSENFGLGLRGEYFEDLDGAAMGVNDLSVTEFTLSANLKEGPFTFIPEFRIDSGSVDIFTDADGNATGSSPSFLMGVVYSF